MLKTAINVTMLAFLLTFSCVSALGCVTQEERVTNNIERLKDEGKNTRVVAAERLGESGSLRAVEPLIMALEDEYWEVREAAAETLGKIGDPRAVEPLILTLELEDESADVGREAALALGEIGDSRAVEPLIAALRREYPENFWESKVRYGAAIALGKIGDPRAVRPLIAALEDEMIGESLAEEALVSFGTLAIEPLLDAFDNGAPGFQEQILEILQEIGGQSIDVLVSNLQDDRLDIVARMYSFFIETGEPGTEDILAEALNKYGTKDMAVDYLNSGNEQLEESARSWAASNGYRIIQQPGSRGPEWGNQR